jgi:hypothetical protein
MSHLQPNFIAKNKARIRNAHAPRSMPRSMIKKEAARYPMADWGGIPDNMYYSWCDVINHRIFTLRK